MPDGIAQLLEINASGSNSYVARQKIVKYHFSDGDKNIETFAVMETSVLPSVMEWIGKDDLGLSLMHRLVHEMSWLFESKTELGGK